MIPTFDPAAPGLAKALGPLEAQMMYVLWQHGPSTMREVQTALAHEGCVVTESTVVSTMQRLALKRMAHRVHTATTSRFVATVTEDAFIAAMVAEVLGSLLRDYRDTTARVFIERIGQGG